MKQRRRKLNNSKLFRKDTTSLLSPIYMSLHKCHLKFAISNFTKRLCQFNELKISLFALLQARFIICKQEEKAINVEKANICTLKRLKHKTFKFHHLRMLVKSIIMLCLFRTVFEFNFFLLCFQELKSVYLSAFLRSLFFSFFNKSC